MAKRWWGQQSKFPCLRLGLGSPRIFSILNSQFLTESFPASRSQSGLGKEKKINILTRSIDCLKISFHFFKSIFCTNGKLFLGFKFRNSTNFYWIWRKNCFSVSTVHQKLTICGGESLKTPIQAITIFWGDNWTRQEVDNHNKTQTMTEVFPAVWAFTCFEGLGTLVGTADSRPEGQGYIT